MTAPTFKEALGAIVSMLADARDVFPDHATTVEAVTESVNELYACLEDGVFGDVGELGIPQRAVSMMTDFYPEEKEPDDYDGTTLAWTFRLPKTALAGPGVYEIRFLHSVKGAAE